MGVLRLRDGPPAASQAGPGGPPGNVNIEAYLYGNSPAMQRALVISMWFYIGIVTLTMIPRLFVRFAVLKLRNWEDYCMWLAYIGLIGTCVFALKMMDWGSIDLLTALRRDRGKTVGRLVGIVNSLYFPIIALAKLSLLLQISRNLLPIRKTRAWWSMQAFIIICMAFYIGGLISTEVHCGPGVRKQTAGHIIGACPQYADISIVVGSFNALADFIMLVMPIWTVCRLHMNKRTKVLVGLVFATGSCACAASVTRLGYSVIYRRRIDITGPIIVQICGTSEIAAAIICGNLANFPAFIRHVCTKFPSTTKSKGSSSRSAQPTDSSGLSSHGTPQIERKLLHTSWYQQPQGKADKDAYIVLEELHVSDDREIRDAEGKLGAVM